jgi:hypothetical protein
VRRRTETDGRVGYNRTVLAGVLPALMAMCMVHTPDLDPEVGRRALPWLPPDLARQVVRHKSDFARGGAAAAAWPRQFHRPGGADGLEATILAQCERLVQALRSQAPFSEVVAGLGTLAHLSMDLNAPFVAHDGDAYAQAFASYQRSAAPRVPIVFYTQDRLQLTIPRAAIEPYLRTRRQLASRLAPLVRYDLDRVGGPGHWPALDDRSTSFGAASLAINHASSVFANLAAWIWRQGGGLVPEIQKGGAPGILVWKGEPRPREAPRIHLTVR